MPSPPGRPTAATKGITTTSVGKTPEETLSLNPSLAHVAFACDVFIWSIIYLRSGP